MISEAPFHIGEFQIYPEENSIQYLENEKKHLQPKFIQVLIYLAKHYPRLISREELIQEIWDGNFYVGEKSVTNAIWHLRQCFKSIDREFIETIRKSGYRLLVEPSFKQDCQKHLSQTIIQTKVNRLTVVLSTLCLSLVLSGVLFFSISAPIQSFFLKSEPDFKTEFITNDSGLELYPSVSKDGQFLLYTRKSFDESSDLFRLNLNKIGAVPEQLTFSTQTEKRAVWGKDNKTIYFVQKDDDKQFCQIMTLELLSRNMSSIANCPYQNNVYIDISPDFSELMFRGLHKGKNGLHIYDLTKKSRRDSLVCFEDCEFDYRDISYSPNGKYLALTRRTGTISENIILFDRTTLLKRTLSHDIEDVLGLTWHLDSQRIIFSGEKYGQRKGYVIHVSNPSIQILDVDGFSFPSMSLTSNDVVYYEKTNVNHIAYFLLKDKGSSFPLIQSEFQHQNAHYSEVQKRLVFSSNRSGSFELWTSDIHGNDRKQLTQLNTSAFYPQWSPDGESIAFLAPNSSGIGNNLFVYEFLDQKIRLVRTGFTRHLRPTWAPNGRSLIVAMKDANQYNLYQVSVMDSKNKQITRQGAFFGMLTSDNKLFFSRKENEGIWVKSLFGSDSSEQLIKKTVPSSGYNWTLTNSGIIFLKYDKGVRHVMHYNFDLDKLELVNSLPPMSIDEFGSFQYIAILNRLVYTAKELPSVDIKRLTHASLR